MKIGVDTKEGKKAPQKSVITAGNLITGS